MSNIQINPYTFGGGAVGAWKEVGRTTLSSPGTLDITGLPDKRYYMFLNETLGTGYSGVWFNSDTGTNYSRRVSVDGASDVTAINQTFLQVGEGDGFPGFNVGYITNISDKEKLLMSWNTEAQTGAGGGNAPSRRDFVGKWANTSSVISTMNNYNLDGSALGYFDIGSEAIVLGWDTTDTHTTADNFWEELDDSTWSSGDSWTSGTFTAKKYLWVQFYSKSAGGSNYCRFNGDSGTNYANRYSIDGGTDSTIDTQPESYLGAIDGLSFNNLFIINNSANEKLLMANRVSRSTAGEGTAPTRMESVGKWANTSSQITSITITTAGGGSFTAGQMKVWGSN